MEVGLVPRGCDGSRQLRHPITGHDPESRESTSSQFYSIFTDTFTSFDASMVFGNFFAESGSEGKIHIRKMLPKPLGQSMGQFGILF